MPERARNAARRVSVQGTGAHGSMAPASCPGSRTPSPAESPGKGVCANMAADGIRSITQSWETVRYELLNTRIVDLRLRIEGSPLEPLTRRLRREMTSRRLAFQPEFYLTDGWGCPDRVPVIGIPFYLADRRLRRLEDEQTGEVEDEKTVMMFLRHEAGHAVNYAWRLWKLPDWVKVFGAFTRPYREEFKPDPLSRRFVRHIEAWRYGRTYAQKHPDEDFAETFAVWLTPRSSWRARYRNWPALAKLEFVDELMRTVGHQKPKRLSHRLVRPAETMEVLLADYYGQKAERLRQAAQGYVDDKLREIFPEVRGQSTLPAADLLRQHRGDLLARVVRWSGLDEEEGGELLGKLETRCETLALQYRRREASRRLMDVTAMAVSLANDFAYSGRFAD